MDDAARDYLNETSQWSLAHFARENLPVEVGPVPCPRDFSRRIPWGRGYPGVLDLPIYMPGQGWGLLGKLDQFAALVRQAVAFEEEIDTDWTQGYVYITVDQRPVNPLESQRRAGFHGDSFVPCGEDGQLDIVPSNSEKLHGMAGKRAERTYVAYDCLPTLFAPGPFDLTDARGDAAIEGSFDIQAARKLLLTFDPYLLLCMTPFCIHAVDTNRTTRTLQRTFVKISFSRLQFNREGNTRNPLFKYEWDMVPRIEGRNHKAAVGV